MGKKGFSLLELLVVIVMIGIFAAIAFPRYHLAVEKARASEALVWMKTLAEAEERYYLATGNYTTDYSQLDINRPDSRQYIIDLDSSVYNIRVIPQGFAAGKYHLRYFMQNVPATSYPGRFLCLHPEGDTSYKNLCLSLGGTGEHRYKHMTTAQTAYFLK